MYFHQVIKFRHDLITNTCVWAGLTLFIVLTTTICLLNLCILTWLPVNHVHLHDLGKSMMVFHSNFTVGRESQEKIQTGQGHADPSRRGDLSTARVSQSLNQSHEQKLAMSLEMLGTSLIGIRDSASVPTGLPKAIIALDHTYANRNKAHVNFNFCKPLTIIIIKTQNATFFFSSNPCAFLFSV